MRVQLGLGLASLIAAGSVHASVLTVNPNIISDNITTFSSISSAVNFADTDVNLANTYDVQIASGTYVNDFALVTRPMTIEAIGGSGVTMQANGQLLQSQGIIVIPSSFIGNANTGLTVKGITLQGAAISDALGGNGAGIRDQAPGGTTLRVENSQFIGNQDGILTAGSNYQEKIEIVGSTFLDNGSGTGQTHALYVGDALSLLVQNSLFCGTLEGHDIKSRAMSTTVQGSKLFDGATGAGCNSAGTTSFSIEATNGGTVKIEDTDIVQGSGTHNTTMVRFGSDGLFPNSTLSIINTNFDNSGVNGVGIQAPAGATGCTLQNTNFNGVNTLFTPDTFCTTVAGPVGVGEPGTLALLLTALGCGAALLFARYLPPPCPVS